MAPRSSAKSSDEAATNARPYHHGDLRSALIRAGLDILQAEGHRALTMRAVARHAGVSHNAPYRHFADKEALLAAIAVEGFQGLTASLAAALTLAGTTARAQLEETGWAYVAFAIEHPAHLRVMFGGIIATPEKHPSLLAAGAQAFLTLVGIVAHGQETRELAGGDPQQLAFTAWALVHGLALLVLDQQVPVAVRSAQSTSQLVRLSLRHSFEGLVRRAER